MTPINNTPPAPPEVDLHLVGTDHTVRAAEIAPGIYAPSEALPREVVPRYGICQLMRQADGSYLPVLKGWAPKWKLVTDPEKIRAALGIAINYRTLIRLWRAGFIAASMPGPSTTLIDLASLTNHLNATQDPEFWTPERRARYSATVGEV